MRKKHIALLGSTGSIGKQALEIVAENPKLFKITTLTAGDNATLLIKQAFIFKPSQVVIGNYQKYKMVKEALDPIGIETLVGEENLTEVVKNNNIDIVLVALVGYVGLKPTINAIKSKKDIAIANKETLVVAGELVCLLAEKYKVNILPIDSEHSAIFQCMIGEKNNTIEKIILTASGGPFRGKIKKELINVTKEEALKHPNWNMGAKITIDSATLMNKGLEVIEAKWLFKLRREQIEVIIHPQSIIHSMVEFNDGSIKAQMGLPNMKLPILYALNYPERIKTNFPRFTFTEYSVFTFELPDTETFVNLQLAFEAIKKGGNMPCILNAANEVAVARFLKNEISFLDIANINSLCMEKIDFIAKPSYEDLAESDLLTRKLAASLKH